MPKLEQGYARPFLDTYLVGFSASLFQPYGKDGKGYVLTFSHCW